MRKCVVKLTNKFYDSVAGTIARLYKDTKEGNVEDIEQYEMLNNPNIEQIEENVCEIGRIIREENNDPVTAFVYSNNRLKYAYVISYKDSELDLPEVRKLDIDSIRLITSADKLGIPMEKIWFNEKFESEHTNGKVFKVIANHSLETYQNGILYGKAFMVIGLVILLIYGAIKQGVIDTGDIEESVIDALGLGTSGLYLPGGLALYLLSKYRLNKEVKTFTKK